MPTLKHKFTIGEAVYTVRLGSKEVRDPCPTCSSSGIDLTKFSCRGCASRGYITRWIPHVYTYHGPFIIGQVTIVRSRPRDCYAKAGDRNVDEVIYMMHETGVGSGTCYNEKDLVRGEEKAKKECARRQKQLDAAKRMEKETTS